MSTDDRRPSFRDRKPSFGKDKRGPGGAGKPFRSAGPRGDDRPRKFGDGPRGPRRDGPGASRSDGPRGPRAFGDGPRGPRRDGPSGPRKFGDGPRAERGPRRESRDFRDDRSRSPWREDFSPPRAPSRGPRLDGSSTTATTRKEAAPAPAESKEIRQSQRADRPLKRRGPPYATGPSPGYVAPVSPVIAPKSSRTLPDRPHLGDDELRYLGKNACLALFKARPNDIVRIYVLHELAAEFKPMIDFCAQNRKSYHLVDAEDLERLTDSVHHQGICVVARARKFLAEKHFYGELGSGRTLVIYLDGVGNPHNLGAIMRTAAHFGVRFICVPEEAMEKISPAIYRTAEGAAEIISIVQVEDNEKFLDRLQNQGFHLYAFEAGEKSKSLFETRLNEKAVFVFGAEVEGLSGIVRTVVETKVAIPGTGAVESLNVSVAAAIAMAEFEKQGQQRSVRIVKKAP